MKIYAEHLEATALEQFKSAMSMPFVVDGALMPDAHTGYSLPIGAVVSTRNMIVPAWVGYDIGCGMCAVNLGKVDLYKEYNEAIFDAIYAAVPVGFNVNTSKLDYSLEGLTVEGRKIATQKKYRHALGSLGGGNHFIEIGISSEGDTWVVIHSGSRGVGHGIATHYMTVASSNPVLIGEEFDRNNTDVLKYNPSQYSNIKAKYIKKKVGKLRPKEGHYTLDVSSEEGQDYIQDMNWCLDYALANRIEMAKRVASVLGVVFNTARVINRNHNHATFRDGVWIHRKGATHAEEGMMGVIPGNMRDGSFIVRGKGNPESLYSSSHGAGRVLGRRKAKETLNIEEFKETMQGVTAKVGEDTLDESPFAYKDIFEVMRLQEDLVEVITHIRPLINIKG